MIFFFNYVLLHIALWLLIKFKNMKSEHIKLSNNYKLQFITLNCNITLLKNTHQHTTVIILINV